MQKTCSRCKVSKEDTEFGTSNRNHDGKDNYCKECRKAAAKKHRDANKEKIAANAKAYRKTYTAKERSDMKRQARYGIKPETLNAYVVLQNNACAICHNEFVDGKFAVDHDHKADKPVWIRGLLCDNCNKLLGHAKDDPVILANAIHYLQLRPTIALES